MKFPDINFPYFFQDINEFPDFPWLYRHPVVVFHGWCLISTKIIYEKKVPQIPCKKCFPRKQIFSECQFSFLLCPFHNKVAHLIGLAFPRLDTTSRIMINKTCLKKVMSKRKSIYRTFFPLHFYPTPNLCQAPSWCYLEHIT